MAKDSEPPAVPADLPDGTIPVRIRAPSPNRTTFGVVGIGASAGGLDASRKFLDALPARIKDAYILILHLDPVQPSMMVDLLANHAALTVQAAVDGARIEPRNLYVIPPGSYLAVSDGVLRLSPPTAAHGARMPIDFLFASLARAYGSRASCVILSGTGTDGSIGLTDIAAHGGYVIAQDPQEASQSGMPNSAIRTGLVNEVLPLRDIPHALAERRTTRAPSAGDTSLPVALMASIISLLRERTSHDFSLYKRGTLERRVLRRMATVGFDASLGDRYLNLLRTSDAEREALAKTLLINVTSFFRDPAVFAYLSEQVLPTLLTHNADGDTVRVWVCGCSTGEEAYSLAMIFQEYLEGAKSSVKLQILASDADPDAIADARSGHFPNSIEADVSRPRLDRFFIKTEDGYQVSPDLRAAIVFSVHDVLIDPPFSRLDLVSCRNLLIYLRAEAQAGVIRTFHFALREGGYLLLGSAEATGRSEDQFKLVSEASRLFQNLPKQIGAAKAFPRQGGEPGSNLRPRSRSDADAARQDSLATLCQRLILETYAPAAVLINSRKECLYSLGPIDRYLRLPVGYPSHDLMVMVPANLRPILSTAIEKAVASVRVIHVRGAKAEKGTARFDISIRPVMHEAEALMLVCFVDAATPAVRRGASAPAGDAAHIAKLERELEASRLELDDAVRRRMTESEDSRVVNQETLSANEEFQLTNEELLTSKEELQSLNEELTALNTQLQETLERQRKTADDLQNILYSTDVATLFLDTTLRIRFFTPATRLLFNVIPSDVGRPLADLNSLSADRALTADARSVLSDLVPLDREIETQTDVWFTRRILPYRTHEGEVEGVVITFNDITERKITAKALETAKRQAELANIGKSRFLAAASHDLRQPLQTLSLVQGLLSSVVTGEKAQKLVSRIEETIGAMSGMLNTLLDINQIEAGTVRAEIATVVVNDVLDRLRGELTYQAEAKGLRLHVIPCSLTVRSDPNLLEQMIRNLLSNALKYTAQGKVLLGCRRHADLLSIEVWDTGIGIPEVEKQAIFEEYHQLDNDARERGRGLGLGLTIVQRLGLLLGHRIRVRSKQGRGSVFAIEVQIPRAPAIGSANEAETPNPPPIDVKAAGATILVVEDDPEVRELLDLLLSAKGHNVVTTPDGVAAGHAVDDGLVRPDLVLADFNLPNGMNGLQVAAHLRQTCGASLPVIVLTGDISTATLRAIALQNCTHLHKPMKPAALLGEIDRLLAKAKTELKPVPVRIPAQDPGAAIHIVDDDAAIRRALRELLEANGHRVADYDSCEAFLAAYVPGSHGCLLIDAYLPGMTGLQLLERLGRDKHPLPAIMITGNSDVPMAVSAMKAGAFDFIEKPVNPTDLLSSLEKALDISRDATKAKAEHDEAVRRFAQLTQRQRQILALVLAGHPSKNIAADLGISQRTVENHRAAIMKKSGARSLPVLARLALASDPTEQA